MPRRILVVLLLMLSVRSMAQQTAIYVDPERRYQSGLDLLLKQKFAAAQKEFRYILSSTDNISNQTRANSAYFIGKCAAELFNQDAENLLLSFIESYPASVYYQSAVYDLGNYYYRAKRYKNAIAWFEKTELTPLAQDKQDEINFKMGYSYYQMNDYEKASKAFYKMKDGNTKYASAAQYYYGHIAYVNENYATALESFN